MAPNSGVGGLLTLLKAGEQRDVQGFAVKRLLQLVDTHWPEISESLRDLEILYEDARFKERLRASLLVSKVFYHLGEFDDAVAYALNARQEFDPGNHDQYTTAIVRKCIDMYSQLQQQRPEDREMEHHQALTILFERLVRAWHEQDPGFKDIREHTGLILEARRLDLLEGLLNAYVSKTKHADMLSHCLHLANAYIEDVRYREEALEMVVRLYKGQQDDRLRSMNYFDMQHCLIFLKDVKQVVKILCKLLDEGGTSELVGYQLAFDLTEHCDQGFLNTVMEGVRAHLAEKRGAPAAAPADEEPVAEKVSRLEREKEKAYEDNEFDRCEAIQAELDALAAAGGGGGDGGSASAPVVSDAEKAAVPPAYRRLFTILIGSSSAELFLHFLTTQNKADMDVMTKIKKTIEQRNSVTHGAAVVANSFLYCGTTQSAFLHQNLEWLGKAQLWAQFTATATIGVINKGHVTKSMQMFEEYRPQSPGTSGGHPYQEGGALYGLGLIHAPIGCNLSEDAAELAVSKTDERTTRPRQVLNYLVQCLQGSQQQPQICHGACLGIGLSSMASRDESLYEILKETLYADQAVGGESAALAIGLVFLGTAEERIIQELLNQGRDTQHEKITRGVSLALSLMSYGREAHADGLVDTLLASKEPWLRLGGVQVIGMAYAGTSNRKALERLLTCSVQDASDDVRRAAITNIGFVAFKDPAMVANLTGLHCDSYQAHVRCGAAQALGIAAAGTANKAALDRLWTMREDTSPYVAQAAIISLSMVLMQKTEKEVPRVKDFREMIQKRMSERYEDQMVKYGCILATGILDAGGRNQLITLHKAGHNLIKPIVGMHLFSQFWYWFPYTLMLSMSLQPTALIALNRELKMPKYKFKSNAPPSQFGVPKKGAGKGSGEHKKREKVVLSTTLRTQRRKKKDGMDVDEEKKEEEKEKEAKKDDKKEEEEEEPSSEILQNPSRVTLGQLEVLSFDVDERYTPVKPGKLTGIVVVSDQKPGDAEELVAELGIEDADDDEPAPPEPFEWP